jgi:hypothetical protein
LYPCLFIETIEEFYRFQNGSGDTIRIFKELSQYVPLRAAVMVSEDYQHTYVPVSQLDYYANRPLIYSRDIGEIKTNHQGCAAYVLEAKDDPNAYQFAEKLKEKYKLVYAEQGCMIFLLSPHPADEQVLPK